MIWCSRTSLARRWWRPAPYSRSVVALRLTICGAQRIAGLGAVAHHCPHDHETPNLLAVLTVAASLGATVGAVSTASAHVSADATLQPAQGGYGQVRLLVPTESDTSPTTAVAVTFPDGVELTSARTLPVPGWTATIDKAAAGSGERVTRITWRADDPQKGLGADEFGAFTFSGGPWPTGKDSVSVPVEQTYGDGTVVKWDEIAVDDQTEPESPAPVVTLSATDDHPGGAHGESSAAAEGSHDGAESGSGDGDAVWQTLSIVGVLVALAALASSIVVWRRTGTRS